MRKIAFCILLLGFAAFPGNLLADGDTDYEDTELEMDSDTETDIEVEEEVEAECSKHEDCPASYACDAGSCVELASGACNKDIDCDYPQHQYCEESSGKCRYWCLNDTHCHDGEEYCDLNTYKCLPIPQTDGDSETFCLDDWDCEDNLVCDLVTHGCVDKCYSDADCLEGEMCQDYHCVSIDGDVDKPWDVDGDLDEDRFEIPEGYEMPGSDNDGGSSEVGGLSNCDPGEVCTEDGDSTDSGSSSNCSQGNSSSEALLLLALFALLCIRQRKYSESR